MASQLHTGPIVEDGPPRCRQVNPTVGFPKGGREEGGLGIPSIWTERLTPAPHSTAGNSAGRLSLLLELNLPTWRQLLCAKAPVLTHAQHPKTGRERKMDRKHWRLLEEILGKKKSQKDSKRNLGAAFHLVTKELDRDLDGWPLIPHCSRGDWPLLNQL